MTYKDAYIQMLKYLTKCLEGKNNEVDGFPYGMFMLSIEALEKQLPEKVGLTPCSCYDDGKRRYVCGRCENVINGLPISDENSKLESYCPHCGQRTDFSEYE